MTGHRLPQVEPEPVCLDARTNGDHCQGAVEYRESLSGTGVPIPRCAFHWTERLILQEQLRRRYPEQAPADFDPLYAGESWDEDE